MQEGFSQLNATPARRDPGIASTSITNELADAMSRLMLGVVDGPGPAGQAYFAKITGNEAGPEKYTATIYTPAYDLCDPSQGVTAADIEVVQSYGNAIFVNLQGVGSSGWSLTHANNTVQKYFICTYIGHSPESPPRAVFAGNAIWLDPCDEE